MAGKAQMSDAEMAAVTKSTAEALAAMPTRKVKLFQVPEGSTDNRLPDETVQINGFTYQIQRGVEVEVPEEVAAILERAGRL